MILVIDNYDSFTWNVAQYLGELSADVKVVRNDAVTINEVADMSVEKIIISPGPCTPKEAGICVELIRQLGDKIPILGICLGHQCIGQAFGGEIASATRIMHGKLSQVHHDNQGVFHDLPLPFEATRYHSLVVRGESLPDSLLVTAWTDDEPNGKQEIMGLKHRHLPIEGVQFHPESIKTECGHQLLANFLAH